MADAVYDGDRYPPPPIAGESWLSGSGLEGGNALVVAAPRSFGTFAELGPSPKIVVHRLRIANRREVADFVRTFPKVEGGNYLRAVFVDEDCRYLGTSLIAQDEEQIRSYSSADVLEAAFLARASGMILARGSSEPSFVIGTDEVMRARRLKALGDQVEVYVLDYVIVTDANAPGLFAIRQRAIA